MSNRRRVSTPFNVRISLSGLLLLALHCTPSVAQDTVPDTSEESTIVVEGSRDLDNAREEAERLAREQASEITRAARRGLPLERHHLPVCPFVNGMNDAVSEFIVRRMKSNAASIGVEAGGADCSKNIFVGLVSDVEMEVAALLKDEAWAFGELRRYQIDRITSETGPSRAWHVSIIGDRFGSPKKDAQGRQLERISPSGSRIVPPITQLISGAVVLIEKAAVIGKTPQQIADFATFRALVPVNTANPNIDSILTLFRDEDAPQELTDFDRAYLVAYYSDDTRNLSSENVFGTIGERYADNFDVGETSN